MIDSTEKVISNSRRAENHYVLSVKLALSNYLAVLLYDWSGERITSFDIPSMSVGAARRHPRSFQLDLNKATLENPQGVEPGIYEKSLRSPTYT